MHSWATELETIFKANGLEEVTADCHPTTPSHYTYQHDLILMTYDELTRAFLDRLGEKEGMHGREHLRINHDTNPRKSFYYHYCSILSMVPYSETQLPGF